MQHLEVSCSVRRLLKSLGFKGLTSQETVKFVKAQIRAFLSTALDKR